MNGNYSTTAKAERLSDSKTLEFQWKSIDWNKAEIYVNRLQVRIAKATQDKKWNTVKRLQYLLTHSYYANDGRNGNRQNLINDLQFVKDDSGKRLLSIEYDGSFSNLMVCSVKSSGKMKKYI